MRREGVAVTIIVIFLLPGCMDSQEDGPSLIGTEYRDPPEAPDFTLKNQNGADVRHSDYEDKVVVVAFIYTSCPDVCLVISSNLAYVYENLGGHSENVEMISITIDPARDTVSRLSQWTDDMGYQWDHLTHDRGSVMQSVWDNWNVVVDAEHIANSLPPDEASLRFAVLFPDNSTMATDSTCGSADGPSCFDNGSAFAEHAFSESNGIEYDISSGTIGNWTSDESWSWLLHTWDGQNESWVQIEADRLDSMGVTTSTNLAWAASNANLSNLPPGFDCNGHGWVMGSGSGAHCMCNEGYERPDGDWLSCSSTGGEESGEHGHSDESDPHEDALMQYEVGHSTVTFIIDKEQRKRVAYSGIHWDVNEFLQDVKTLADE